MFTKWHRWLRRRYVYFVICGGEPGWPTFYLLRMRASACAAFTDPCFDVPSVLSPVYMLAPHQNFHREGGLTMSRGDVNVAPFLGEILMRRAQQTYYPSYEFLGYQET